MLKLTILFLIVAAIIFILFWPAFRRRVKRGMKTGIILYAGLTVIRLSQARTDQEMLVNFAAILGGFGVLWLSVWAVTNWVLARRPPR